MEKFQSNTYKSQQEHDIAFEESLNAYVENQNQEIPGASPQVIGNYKHESELKFQSKNIVRKIKSYFRK